MVSASAAASSAGLSLVICAVVVLLFDFICCRVRGWLYFDSNLSLGSGLSGTSGINYVLWVC